MDHWSLLMAFPPTPVYPKALDSDYTLYLVYNTTETKIRSDNSPWSQEIDIIPVAADKAELWSSNGFANLDGELLYYDSVEYNEHNKVNKLKGCSRQIGGEKTKYNKRGSWIRSYVVAEHHNQLVTSIMKTENFIGYNFDPRVETLDWRIRNLQELEVIFDDFACPDISFTWNIIENSPVTGILAEYIIEITPPGSINNYKLDFGDGEYTTTSLQGQHRYPLNARVDPVITVANDKCEIVQSPVIRLNPAEPVPLQTTNFDIPIPEISTIPDFTFVPCTVPEPDINIPALVTPCLSLTGQVGPIPSVITGPYINMVSNVNITGASYINMYSSINITGGSFASVIYFNETVPNTIIIDPPIPPTIVVTTQNSNLTFDLNLTEIPRIEVDWGTPPEMEVAMTFAKIAKTPEIFAADEKLMAEFGTEFADLFETRQSMKVEYESVGIPSEIKVILPDDPKVFLDSSSLNDKKIKIDATDVNLPTDIKIHGPDSPIPNFITFNASDLIDAIGKLENISPIKIDFSSIPDTIKIEMEKELPNKIFIEMLKPIPEKIVIESNIPDRIILDCPAGIPLLLPDEFVLPVKFPDVMPEIELVYKGSPIEVKITMDEIIPKNQDGQQCFMLVPCK